MNFIVSPKWVQKQLENELDIAIVDVRFSLADPDYGRRTYEEEHIKGAVYLDLNIDLSSEPQVHGGNHPLPNIESLASKLSSLGIDEKTTVVIYDEANDMFASRAWWLLYYMGHEKVHIMDGGIKAWQQLGYEVTEIISQPSKKVYKPSIRNNKIVDMETVKHRDQDESVLIDARARERYLGEVEPLYHKSGHIPGAKNYFWQDVFDVEGKWKSVESLQQDFQQLKKDTIKEIIVSCGSGVSACPNIVALKMAGFKNVKLYPGSFSDWISYDHNELETVDETNN